METITPHLWFDKEAKEAAAFYTSVFPDSRVKNQFTITGTPTGDCDIVGFELWGQPFEAISAGPHFKFNPSVSFLVNFDPSREENAAEMLDQVWEKLVQGGSVLMPLQEYPFSKRYGWVADRYGLSWQLILADPGGDERPPIVPALLFVGSNCGRAEEARSFYTSVFPASEKGLLVHYDANQPPEREGTVMFTDFKVLGTWIAAMDSAAEHDFAFNEAVSLIVNCDTQSQIDAYWEKLSADPRAEQCGWLKDKFGVSWQIVPRAMQDMMASADPQTLSRITQAFLKMKKLNLAEIEKAAAAQPEKLKPPAKQPVAANRTAGKPREASASKKSAPKKKTKAAGKTKGKASRKAAAKKTPARPAKKAAKKGRK